MPTTADSAALVQAVQHPLYLTVGGQVVLPALVAPGCYGFRIGAPLGPLRLRAATFSPAALGQSGDARRLGFAVTGLQVITETNSRELSVSLGALQDGFHPYEPGGWRWTDGDAGLPEALLHGIHDDALLVVRGFGRHGPNQDVSHQAAFLAGDSYPADENIENGLLRALAPFMNDGVVRQAAMLPPEHRGHHERNLAARVARLEQAMAGRRGRAVLIGRSSGARVATLFARQHDVAAVVCLGFPFHGPGRADEPERYAHLATLTTPTLIIQGRDDPYGDAETVRRCALSPQVSVHLIDGGHEFNLTAAQWAALARRILLFLAEHS